MGEGPVKRRNVHEHPDADEDEVNDYLQATIEHLVPVIFGTTC